jgi:hypothetical protein
MMMIMELTINLTELETSESAKFIATTIANNTITTKMIIAKYIGATHELSMVNGQYFTTAH